MLDKIAKHRTTILKNSFSILLLFLILVVEGCFNFLEFKFTFEKILNFAFWINVSFKVLLLVLVKVWIMSMFIDIARKNNDELHFQKRFNTHLMQSKDNEFPKWIENVENREIKIEYFKRKINKKLAKLEHKAKPEDRMLYFNDNEEYKSNNEYCVKRAELEYLLTDDYINNNYNWLDINNYPVLDSAVFDCPIGNENVDKKYQLASKVKTAILSSLTSACIITILFQTFWNSMDLSRNNLSALVIFSGLIMDMIFIIWQGLTGVNSAFKIIDNQEVLPYVNRNRILEKYIYFKNPDNPQQVKEYINTAKKECRNG